MTTPPQNHLPELTEDMIATLVQKFVCTPHFTITDTKHDGDDLLVKVVVRRRWKTVCRLSFLPPTILGGNRWTYGGTLLRDW